MLKKIFGTRNQRLIKKLSKQVTSINALEPTMQALTDQQLREKTDEFKTRYQQGASLDQLLPEAFAVVREASFRVKGLRHYDVQLIGGMVLHRGKIAEMATGEGKTLVATLPAYLNGLTGKGVHVITVNDYLAQRDAESMSKLYDFLGLTTGVIVANLSPEARKEAYACDITYGTNNEFGFDYLRDNMAFSVGEQVQRSRNFVIIDEVDSILIDEARTPLIISGATDDSTELYDVFNQLVPGLKKQTDETAEDGDFYVDEKSRQAFLTDQGHETIEQMLHQQGILGEGENLYSPQHVTKMHYLNAAVRAHYLYKRDVDYIVRDQQVIIIDESTGRAMEGRRWSDGLHQAIEAKEGVEIQGENQTLASITFQNFFKLYNKMSGMTGTADTEALEFHQIYNLEVVGIPTNRPIQRKDHHDVIYGGQKEKFQAIADEIQQRTEKGQPVLVGTASIETSETLATLLKKRKVAHNVLNAKNHGKEAQIIAQAGYPGAVTIATNMAGRGTDIILGGNWEAEIQDWETPPDEAQLAEIKEAWKERNQTVLQAGGLCVIGSERHDSRRIDNQLRGRAGRQGDPGESRFFLSMDDSLLRIFASEAMANRMKSALQGGESLQLGLISRFVAKAQQKVERYHFDIRKNLLEYDNVANSQRQVIYKQRQELLEKEDVSNIIENMRQEVLEQLFVQYVPKDTLEDQWDLEGLAQLLKSDFDTAVDFNQWLEIDNIDDQDIKQQLIEKIASDYQSKIQSLADEDIQRLERVTLMQSLDSHWRDHLSALDHLRNSINLRGYAQKDPKNEYKREAFELFSSMLDGFKYEVIANLSKVRIQTPEEAEAMEQQWKQSVKHMEAQHEAVLSDVGADDDSNKASQSQQGTSGEERAAPYVRQAPKTRRNDPCPCGSGKKYKHCHGKLADS